MVADPLAKLHEVFGYNQFRGVQEQVVDRVLNRQRTLAVMPTGAGKSLCYQLPAVMMDGCCVVVSPLIALMHDQLRAAEAVGIRAATLTSVDQNRGETMARFRDGQLDLLYVAPERASSGHFRELLGSAPLSLFAIDEAHCVSEWGHDFRPDYRLLEPLMDTFPEVPRLALTATADAHTRADIAKQLGIPTEGMIVSGFDRPNIRYAISPKANVNLQIARVVADTPGPGIVYAQTRAATEKLAEALARTGRPVRAYHAGLDPAVRAKNQADFVASEDMVICATVAFGMGIDRPDVRFVAHASMPKGVEQYVQETGRAGRDGLPSECVLFAKTSDRQSWGRLIERSTQEAILEGGDESALLDEERGAMVRLDEIAGYASAAGCRHRHLAAHFGQSLEERDCGACDVCLGELESVSDSTSLARALVSAVLATGERFGAGHVSEVLRGSNAARIHKYKHNELPCHGSLKEHTTSTMRAWLEQLASQGYLRVEPGPYPTLSLSPTGRALLEGEGEVALVQTAGSERRAKKPKRRGAAVDLEGDDLKLFESLRELRRSLASERGIPPYLICNDRTLIALASLRPTDRAELLEIPGIGEKKASDLGPLFLKAIAGA